MQLPLARRILSEAHDLGVGLVVVSGGEPPLHPGFFQLPREMLDIPFIVFTNGAYVRTSVPRRRAGEPQHALARER